MIEDQQALKTINALNVALLELHDLEIAYPDMGKFATREVTETRNALIRLFEGP